MNTYKISLKLRLSFVHILWK